MMLKRIVLSVCAAVAAVFAAVSARAGVAYIESDGVDDWLDTECKATPQTKIVMDMVWMGNVKGYPFGSTKDGVNMCIGVAGGEIPTGTIYWRIKERAKFDVYPPPPDVF